MPDSKPNVFSTIKAEDISYVGESKTYGWGWGTVPDGISWKTDNVNGFIETGWEKTSYGGPGYGNKVIELEAFKGDASNLYTYMQAAKGEKIDFSFDLSNRDNPGYKTSPESSTVEVLWQGKVIDTIVPGSSFHWDTHSYSLTASGLNDRLELRSTTHDSIGAVIDNLNLSSAAEVRSTVAADSVLAEQVSHDVRAIQNGWSAGHLPQDSLWATDNKNGVVETGLETGYGGTDRSNIVIELEAYSGDASNLYTYFHGDAGQNIRLDFDFSARSRFGGTNSAMEVLWQGKVLETITPGDVFKFEHHTFNVTTSGGEDRLELRAVTHDSFGTILDNIAIVAPDHVLQHAQPVVG